MATLPTCFRDALTNIQPAVDEKNAAKAHAEVSKVLTGDKELKALGISPVLIGSYAREVSIRRVKDVDVFGRLTLADDTLAPGKAMDLFESALEAEYGDRVERQHRSFKVEFPDYATCALTRSRLARAGTTGRSPTGLTSGPAGSRPTPSSSTS